MDDPESEQFVQIFLFIATIFCYFLLFIFFTYGLYSCCVKKVFDSYRKRREEQMYQTERQVTEEGENQRTRRNMAFGADVNLIVSNEKNKKVAIVPMTSDTANANGGEHLDLSGNNNTNANVSDDNHFVDKKYYDIFKA